MSETENSATRFEHTFQLPASVEWLFAACTEVDQLRAWFAERVELELKLGGRFVFGGRGVLGPCDAAVVLLEPGASFAFEGTWAGVKSAIKWRFAKGETPSWACTPGETPDPARKWTDFTVLHQLEQALPLPKPELVVDDYWRLATANLLGHIDGRGNVLLPDFADPEPVIRLSIEIDAPPPAVFRALTTPEILNQWIAKEARVEPRVGGAFDLGWGPAAEHVKPMRILEFEENVLLSFSWPDWRQQPDVPDQTVSFRLVPLEDGRRTKVEFTHAGFLRTVDKSDYQQGWTPFLDGLAKAAPNA
ncbi:MAG: SRPBCC domain-containing protein [Myxococcota bacterium]